MADNSGSHRNHGVVLNIEAEGNQNPPPLASDACFTIPFMQKVTGISIVWGLAVMVLVYSVGHISGAHFNPAVTIAFATCKRFPLNQVPAYITAQVFGSTMAAGTLRLLFSGTHDVFAGTSPQGSDLQAFVIEFIITFYLMFIISGVATDNRDVVFGDQEPWGWKESWIDLSCLLADV